MKTLNIINDVDLLKRLRQSDESAFRYLYTLYFEPIRKNILQFIADQGVASDIHQEVFITLWEKREVLPIDLNIKSWLFTVSYNRSISFLRKKEKFVFSELNNYDLFDHTHSSSESNIDNTELRKRLLNSGLRQLSPQRKKALMLYKISKHSYQDIAKEMNLSTQTVKQYVKMAMMFLRKYAQDNGYELFIIITLIGWSVYLYGI